MSKQGRAEFDPYRPPRDSGEDQDERRVGSTSDLADRGTRFMAALVDGLIAIAITLPAQFSLGVYDGFPNVRQPGIGENILWGLGSFVLWLALHGYFVARGGQTIGKRLLKVRVVRATTGEQVTLAQYALLRALPISAAAMIPVVGPFAGLVDVLFIFRKDRRCVHDLIADTRVVKAE